MKSPFPGMDPFIESQNKWAGFHTRYLTAIGDWLVARVRPDYEVQIEEYVYLLEEREHSIGRIAPDVHVSDAGHGWREYAGTAVASSVEPVTRALVQEEPIEQTYLTIRDLENRMVVAVIELLSPTNKDGGQGAREYRQKRANVCRSDAHLVEIDLLRGGQRLPTTEPLPPGDYYAFVTRKWQSPNAAVYAWSLRHRMPQIPIPLKEHDADVPLDLQAVFEQVYERSGYDYSLRYDRPLSPPLSAPDQEWAAAIVAAHQSPIAIAPQKAAP